MILLPHLLSDFRFLFHYICGSLFIREPVWLFPLLSYCVSCNGFVVLFFYPELIKSLLPFVMVLVFLLLLVRLVLHFTGLFCLLLAYSFLYAALFSMLVLLACFPFCLVLELVCCYVVGFAFCVGSLPVCSLVLLVCFPLDLVLGLAYCCVVGFAIYAGFLLVFSWLLKSRFDYCCWLC